MKKILILSSLFFFFIQVNIAQEKKEITLEDIYQKNIFSAKKIYGIRSMKNGEYYTIQDYASVGAPIVMFEYKTGNAVDTLLRNSWLKVKSSEASIGIENYQFSADESKILVTSGSEKIYRHSTKENYYIWDRKAKTTTFISASGKQMHADFSPIGSKIGFVRDNNLFMYDLESGKETQITSDGKTNNIINGATDWVYEEEFSFDKAWCWSPDGSKIAYYRFDESRVKEFNMPKYGSLYPSDYKFKYPKAGEENSKVQIYIYNVMTGSKQMVDLGNEYEYIPRIKWTTNSNSLSIQRMNRLQNKLELLLADATTGKTTVILTETSNTYIDIDDDLTFLPGKNDFIWTSDKDGYNHFYLYDINGKLINQITKGNWDVEEMKGYNEKTKTIYFISSETAPINKHLYSVSTDGSNKKKLTDFSGIEDADFNATYTYYIHTYSNVNQPPLVVLRTTKGAEVRTLENNAALVKKASEYNFTKKEFFKFKTNEGIELNGWMMKPTAFSASAKYPVLMFVYGGPGSNTVNNTWDKDFAWYQMLCAKGYIIVSVDNRGTGRRGAAFKKCTYKENGKLETEDQIAAAKYLGTLPYVDKSRIGIWGWSYGGFMSSLCIMKGADVFKMAMAVAPVTNWRYYDSIYTERYLGLPKDNASGYDENSPINHVDKLKGKFLLVHGTGDDNVHFQNSMEMVTALQKVNKQFELMVYPDKAHGMGGKSTSMHLYSMLTNFVLENL